jgi:hypothetical protein
MRNGRIPRPDVKARHPIGILLLAFFVNYASDSHAQVSIYPAQPKQYETVRLQAPQGVPTSEILDMRGMAVRMQGSKITVSLLSKGTAPTLPEPTPPFDLPLGQFPAGNYQAELQVVSSTGTVLRSLGSATFSVDGRSADNDPLWNLTDLWWDPAESGWGINIVQHGSGKIFATWFVYGSDGAPVWYVIPDGQWLASGVAYSGQIYRTTGPQFCNSGEACTGPAFDSSKVTVTWVGEGTISLDPNRFDRAVVTLTVDGKTFSRVVQRQSF